MSQGRAIEVTTPRDLEKEFASIAKLFVGKETEQNWEARDVSVRRLRSFLSQKDQVELFKDSIVLGIQHVLTGVIKTIHSLRTSVASEALSLIEDIAIAVGDSLNAYTLEIILSNLLKCSSVTKKLIATKTAEVTHSFLTNTNFHSKIIQLLCKTIHEKNVQLRQYAANYLKTVLETHGSKDVVYSAIAEKLDLSQSIQTFLKKGLTDSSPLVREASRQTYSAYYDHWPNQAEKFSKTLDVSTQRLLEKSSPKTSPKPTSIQRPRTPISRSNSMSSISSSSITTSTKATSVSIFKRPGLTRSPSYTSQTSLKSHTNSRSHIPAVSSEIKRNQKISRLSHISHVSAPPNSIQHKMATKTLAATHTASRRTQSEFHQQSVLASASLLHMLKSNDLQMQCKGICTLSERLKNTTYQPSPTSIMLPPDVPSKIEILPIFMDFLSREDLDIDLYQLLMSWESLAGIFVYIMSFNYYCPTLVIADQECKYRKQSGRRHQILSIYSKGLLRIKMFLKRNDPELPQRLLDITKSILEANSPNDIQLLDASVKRDLNLYPDYKESLICGMFAWMDQILCDYVGLPEDEDSEILMEGSQWLATSDKESLAGQWFQDRSHIHSYVQFVVKSLLNLSPHSGSYDILSCMASHLKMANQRVFESELKFLSPESIAVVEKALGVQPSSSFDRLLLDNEEGDAGGSTGMTQDISKIRLELASELAEPFMQQDDDEDEDDEAIFSFDTERTPPSLEISDELPPFQEGSSNMMKTPEPDEQIVSLRKKPVHTLDFDESEDEKEEITSKKRRLSNPIIDDQPIKHLINLIQQDKADRSTYQHLQQLIYSDSHKEAWSVHLNDQSTLCQQLINVLIESLEKDGQRPDFLQAETIAIIRSLLTHMPQNMSVDKPLASSMIRALVNSQTDNNSNVYAIAEEAIDLLFQRLLPDDALTILWDLPKQQGKYEQQDSHLLGAIFSHVSKIAPKASPTTLEQTLQNGAVDILVKGYNHSSISVRKSCVLASVSIHKVLGDAYIKDYLSVLRAEQLTLLQHYISKQNYTH
ncbi:Protein STU1 [Choanephora cucurbitarum]|uniref:Protein STU1 n=1 Tax=Choanephora cucurbitarum TaxID=101091 RepID=A0A1C7N334_9FUNG|nr:Protein STU1 [Choanephora cucurbitarum]